MTIICHFSINNSDNLTLSKREGLYLMSVMNIFLLIFGGIGGGIISSVAGGASIISYPLLVMTGIPPLYANVTNHGALILNYVGAIASSTREMKHHWRRIIPLITSLALGVFIGTFLLFHYPATTFEKVVPILLILCGLLFLFNIKPQKLTDQLSIQAKKLIEMVLFILIGCYTGYFGGANGVLILAVLETLTTENFIVNNAMKNTICFWGDLISFSIYLLKAPVYWEGGLFLAIGMIIGGYVGPVILRHVNLKHDRLIVAILAFVQAGYFLLKAY